MLDLQCAPTACDVCLDAAKTHLEFHDWEAALHCVSAAVRSSLVGAEVAHVRCDEPCHVYMLDFMIMKSERRDLERLVLKGVGNTRALDCVSHTATITKTS